MFDIPARDCDTTLKENENYPVILAKTTALNSLFSFNSDRLTLSYFWTFSARILSDEIFWTFYYLCC